jgi:uncharacterized protein YecT (DUF1311 family)
MADIKAECLKTAQCAPLKHHYDECAERVKHQEEQHGKASEDCVEECMYTDPTASRLWLHIQDFTCELLLIKLQSST